MKTKLRDSAERATKLLLNAYNRRKNHEDLEECHVLMEKFMTTLIQQCAGNASKGINDMITEVPAGG